MFTLLFFLYGIDYELVRVHHPDCVTARMLPPSTSHSRFQAISDAYVILSGKKQLSSNSWDRDAPYEAELRRRTRAQWRASAGSDEFGTSSTMGWENANRERWDQGVLIFIVVFVSCPFFAIISVRFCYLSMMVVSFFFSGIIICYFTLVFSVTFCSQYRRPKAWCRSAKSRECTEGGQAFGGDTKSGIGATEEESRFSAW